MVTSFPLPADIASVLQNYDVQDETHDDLVTIALHGLLDDFQSLLRPYLSDSLATISDGTVKIAEDGIDFDHDGKGVIVLEFTEDLWMGCRDIGGPSDREAHLSFQVNIQEGSISVTSMDDQERDPDDL